MDSVARGARGPITLAQVPTPALVLDRARLEANCRTMAQRVAHLGLRLRPHLKTAKCVEVARLATAGHFGGLTVSTLREAEHFAAHGFADLLLAVCLPPDKLPRAAALARRGVRLGFLCDDPEVAAILARDAERLGASLDAWVEVDVGEHRTGLAPDDPALVETAARLHGSDALRLAGVLAHGGHAYGCSGPDALTRIAEEERRLALQAAERLAAAGLPCEQVSVGSTPTCAVARSGQGLSEMRPGVYMFGDLFQAALGACRVEDVALTVLATVVARRPREGRAVIDAGALALSKDRSTAATGADAGFGLVADLHGRLLPGVTVDEVHQEHGRLVGSGPFDPSTLAVGTRVRVLPNHACLTAAAHGAYQVVEGEEPAVLAEWPRVHGW